MDWYENRLLASTTVHNSCWSEAWGQDGWMQEALCPGCLYIVYEQWQNLFACMFSTWMKYDCDTLLIFLVHTLWSIRMLFLSANTVFPNRQSTDRGSGVRKDFNRGKNGLRLTGWAIKCTSHLLNKEKKIEERKTEREKGKVREALKKNIRHKFSYD